MGKLIEGLWDCPFCDNKRIKAGQKTCPLCGHPQDENTKFYMPDAIEYVSEEKAAKISQNPDWPEPKLKDNQRTGTKDEHYFVTATYEKKEGKTETERYEMAFSEWKELKKGEKTDLKIDAAGFAEINKE